MAIAKSAPQIGTRVCGARRMGQISWAPGMACLGLILVAMAAPSPAHAELDWPPGLPEATCDVVSPVPSTAFDVDMTRPAVSLNLTGLETVDQTIAVADEDPVVERIVVTRSDSGRHVRIERRREGESVAFAERQTDERGHCVATSEGAGGGANGQKGLWYGDLLILRVPWASGAAIDIRQSFEYRGRRVVRAVELRGAGQALVRTIGWSPDFRRATISATMETQQDGWKAGVTSKEGFVKFDAAGRPVAGGKSQAYGWTRRYDAAGRWIESRVRRGGKVLKYTARWNDAGRLAALTRPTGQTAWRFDDKTGQLTRETDTERGGRSVTTWTWKGTTLVSAAWESGGERETMTLRWRKGRLRTARFERRVSGRVLETRRATYGYETRR